jgi:hypothetical protein
MIETAKYFYDCPLKAAWMAKHFGMRFSGDKYCLQFDAYGSKPMYYPDLYIIHPDSLRLFDPQPFDLLQGSFCFGRLDYYVLVKEKFNGHGEQITQDRLSDGTFNLDKIIQRDGVSFMWPARED